MPFAHPPHVLDVALLCGMLQEIRSVLISHAEQQLAVSNQKAPPALT